MADQPDWGQVESQLKAKSGGWYDPSMLEDVKRNSSYGAGGGASNVDDWVNRIANKAQLRGTNESNSDYVANGQGGVTVGPTGRVNAPSNPNPTIAGGGMSGSGGGGGNSMPGWFQDWVGQQNERQKVLQGRADNLFATLMGRAKQSLDINAQDPIIRNQVDNFRAEQDRGRRNAMSDLAESSGPYANVSMQGRQMAEKAAQATSGLQASLIGNELTARRNEIQNALTGMAGLLSNDQMLAMQNELGHIDANLKQQQINSGNDQFAAQFGLNAADRANYWDMARRYGMMT